jgi:adenosylhomocysteine nucleosidase
MNPLRLAILAPMPSELAPLVRLLGLARSDDPKRERWHGSVGEVDVVAARTGIGMRRARLATERLLDETSPDHLFIVGIAGGIGPTTRVGTVIHPERVRNLETGEEFRPTRPETTRGEGVLVSSDRFLDPDEARALASEGVIAVDMETAAVGSACARAGCPWSVYRAISDRADDGSTDPAVLGLVDAEGRPRPLAVARFLVTRPRLAPQLVRLARDTGRATRRAARAARDALDALRGSR